MRCGCPVCGTYMIQSEGLTLGCVCPNCMKRCTMCLGTDTVVSREALKSFKNAHFFDADYQIDHPDADPPCSTDDADRHGEKD